MRERYIRKLQKNRHLAEISFNILANVTFKNLSPRERKRMAKLIYKAELLEMEVKSRKIADTMQSFKDLMNNIEMQIKDTKFDDDDDFDNPFR
jgi:myo-inositol-1-phosphate synthase